MMARYFRPMRMEDDESKECQIVEMRGDEIDNVLKSKRRLAVSGLDRYGLCATCYHCFFSRSEFKVKYALCAAMDDSGMMLKLDAREPVTECNSYGERSFKPSLEDMFRMATLIDPPKTKVGF